MTQRIANRGMLVFIAIWLAQVISLLGSSMTSFALGVWVYNRTGSATQFALIWMFATLPGVIVSPLAGALIDRWDRRWALLLSEGGVGFCTLLLALLLYTQQLAVWHIYLIVSFGAIFAAFQWPAFSASVTQLVPKQQLGRANGLVQLGYAIVQVAAPALGGILMQIFDVFGVIRIDLATFACSIITLLIIRIPRPETTAAGVAGKGSLLQEIAYGWNYITARAGLLGLLLFFAFTNFMVGVVQILITPLVLSFASAPMLGLVLSVGGVGMLLGGISISVWGGPRRRIYGVLGFTLLQGMVLLLGGLQPSIPLIAAAAFVFLCAVPMINGSSQAIWQVKVAPDLQGRVFALRGMLASSTLPLAYLAVGPLADNIFEPLLREGGPLAGSVGQIIGVGPGRGIGLLLITLGLCILLAVVAAYGYPRLRNVENELPDAIEREPAPTPEGTEPAPSASPSLTV